MKIVSTTICKNNESAVAGAILSCKDVVDECLILDNGSTDDTIRVALDAAGDKGRVVSFEWQDFGHARNFALEQATIAQADWALTLDSDERLDWNGDDIRAILASSGECRVWHANHQSKTYAKTRFVRLPRVDLPMWEGRTHEALFDMQCALLPKTTFWELDKNPEQLSSKFIRDLELLTLDIESHPNNGRWPYYLGETLVNMERYLEAIDRYQRCSEISAWQEEAGRALYRQAECYCVLDRFEDAVQSCANSLAKFPTGDAAWLAGFACSKLGRGWEAYAWAKMSEAIGYFKGVGACLPRGGFKTVTALYEGPFDLARFHAPTLEEQQAADEMYKTAIEARLGISK